MKQSVKVTLLSLFVFPGVGHIILKKYALAFAFIASSSYILFGFIQEIHEKTQRVVDSALRGEIPIEVSAIRQALIEQGALDINFATIGYLLIVIWLLAAFDAYRIAHNRMNKNVNNDKHQ